MLRMCEFVDWTIFVTNFFVLAYLFRRLLPVRRFICTSLFLFSFSLTQTPTEGSHGSKLGSQAVIEYGKSANFNTADLQSFFKQLNPAQLGETCGVAYGDNNGDVRASVEANLDVQYIMATGQFVNTTTYKIAEPGVGIEDQMLDYTYIVGNQTQPALVHRYVHNLS